MLTEISHYMKAHPEAFPRHRGSDLPLGQGIRKVAAKYGDEFAVYYRGDHYGNFSTIREALEAWNEADHSYWDLLSDDSIHWVSYHGERTHIGQMQGLFDEDGYKLKPLPKEKDGPPPLPASPCLAVSKLCSCGRPARFANDSRCEECWADQNSNLIVTDRR